MTERMVLVIKRDGIKEEYDKSKVIRVIEKAMAEGDTGVDSELSSKIEMEIFEEIINDFHQALFTVDQISDLVEDGLMRNGRYNTAKRFIKYRAKRDEERNKESNKYGILSKEFLSKYKHLPNPFPSALGEMVFYRTYSRWLSELKRREYWWETCKRAVEYNCSLLPNTTKEEAERLFDNMYNLRQFLSGRTLYTGGTTVSKKFPMSNFNCSAIVVDNTSAFHEALYMLLLGSGVGFRVLQSDVDKLPKFNSHLEVIDKNFVPVPKGKRKEHTELTFPSENIAYLTIGDSKSSWTTAIKYLMAFYTDNFYNEIQTVVVDYDNIRPFGEQLKTFGGNASGHEAIKTMIDKISKFITKRGESEKEQYVKLKSIDVLDIITSIAEGVVVGGIRRSSTIAFGEKDDYDFLNSKANLYIQDERGVWTFNEEIANRQLSNNTVYYHEKPNREELHKHVQLMKVSAEPALLNAQEALRRNPNFKLTNPLA